MRIASVSVSARWTSRSSSTASCSSIQRCSCGDQLVEIAARPRDLLEEELDHVPGVDDRALASADDQRPRRELAVVDQPAEQRLVLAAHRERGPVEQPRDRRVVVGRVDDAHQLAPRARRRTACAGRAAGRSGRAARRSRRAPPRARAASRVANSPSLSTTAHASPRARSDAAMSELSLFERVSTITWPSENAGRVPRCCHAGGARRSRSISAPIAGARSLPRRPRDRAGTP